MSKELLGFCDTLAPSTAVYESDLNHLMAEWAQQAWGIERTRGDDDAGARALRACAADLNHLILEYKDRLKQTINNTNEVS